MRKFLMLFLNNMCKAAPLPLGMLQSIHCHFDPIRHNFCPMGFRNPFSRILIHHNAATIFEVWEIIQLNWPSRFTNWRTPEKRVSRRRAAARLDFYLHCFYFLSHFVWNFLEHLLSETALFDGFKIILRADLNFGVLDALSKFLKHLVYLCFLRNTIVHQMLSAHNRGLLWSNCWRLWAEKCGSCNRWTSIWSSAIAKLTGFWRLNKIYGSTFGSFYFLLYYFIQSSLVKR